MSGRSNEYAVLEPLRPSPEPKKVHVDEIGVVSWFQVLLGVVLVYFNRLCCRSGE